MNDTFKKVIGQPVLNMFVPGLIDNDENPPEILLFIEAVWLVMRDITLLIQRRVETNGLRVTYCIERTYPYGFETYSYGFAFDESHERCLASIMSCFTLDTGNDISDVHVEEMAGYNDEFERIEFVVSDSESLTFDARSFQGISIRMEKRAQGGVQHG